MALQAVLFDMDGVIVDTEPLHRKAYFQVFSDLGMDVSEKLYTSFTGLSTFRTIENLKENFDIPLETQEVMRRKRAYFKTYFDTDPDFDLIPGVKDLIIRYYEAGITLVLASSATMTSINMMFDRFDLHGYFKGKISGADLAESKPNPEIFLKAAEISGQPKEKCMVIEDATNGILAAHRAGIFCSAYRSQHSKQQDYSLANLVVSDFRELEPEKINSYFN